MRTSVFGWILLALLSCGLGTGCKDEAPAGGQSPVEVAPAPHGPAETADNAVLAVMEGLNQGHPEVLWDFLPESYQRDLNELVHLFARKMDAELWNKTVAVLRKLVVVLKTKKQFLAADLTPVANLLETLLAGEAADLEKLKAFDGRLFLAGTGARLIAQLRKLLPNVNNMLDFKKVALVKSQGETATVEITTSFDTTEREFVRVEGKWVPKDLAEAWLDQIGNAQAVLSVRLSPDNLAEMKTQVLPLLAAVDGVLDHLAAARNQDDFQAGLKEADVQLVPFKALVAGWLMDSGSGPGASAVDEPARDEPIEFVTVVVTGMLNDDAQDALRARLNAVADDRDRAESEITADDETTTIKVGPVGDIEAFSQRLDFLKVTSIDAKARTITAEPAK